VGAHWGVLRHRSWKAKFEACDSIGSGSATGRVGDQEWRRDQLVSGGRPTGPMDPTIIVVSFPGGPGRRRLPLPRCEDSVPGQGQVVDLGVHEFPVMAFLLHNGLFVQDMSLGVDVRNDPVHPPR